MQRIFRVAERRLAWFQGKGYGAKSVVKEIEAASLFLQSTPVKRCIDVGGNIGNYTAELLNQFPQTKIEVFEPSRKNAEALEQRFQSSGRVRIHAKALSNKTGVATLFSNETGSVLGSLTKRKLDHFQIKFDCEEEIQTVRFDDYWKEKLDSCSIDLLKLDVEGHELHALEGIGKAINNISVIQFEFGGCNIDTRTSFQDFWYFFRDHGFRIYRITPIGICPITQYREADEFYSTTNYIAAAKETKGP